MNSFRAAKLGSHDSSVESPLVLMKAAKSEGESSGGVAGISIKRAEARRKNERASDRVALENERRVTLTVRRKKFDADVLNVSTSGAMVAADADLRIGERVELQYEGHARLPLEVRWLRGWRAGLEIANGVEDAAWRDGFVAPLMEKESDETRERALKPRTVMRDPRRHVIRQAALHLEHDSFGVRVRNVSEWGALVAVDAEIAVDTRVTLDFGACVAVMGEVRWHEDGFTGIRFETQFDVELLSETADSSEGEIVWMKPDYLEEESPSWKKKSRLTIEELRLTLKGIWPGA